MFRNPITWLFLAISLVLIIAIWSTTQRLPSGRIPERLSSAPAQTKMPAQVNIFPSDPVRGATQAKVTIVEFGDFECVYCAQVAATIEKFIGENPNKIRLVWKDFPLPAHSNAQAAAEAGQCAARQGKFWQYHDALFQNQANLNENTYLTIAGQLGLDFNKFSQCLKKHETLPLIQLNQAEGKSIGVDGTPFFVINGQAFSGILTEEQLKSLLK